MMLKMKLAMAAMTAALLPAAALAQETPPPIGASVLMWSPDQQKDGYKAMEKLAAHKVVARGAKVFPLPAGKTIDPKVSIGGKEMSVEAYMAAYRVSGLLVIKDGKVILERYGLERGPNDRWTSFSVAKSMTSTLVGAAIQDGYIKSLNDPVTTYIPELKGGGYDGVTVGQLITMTSGVKWNEDYTDLNSDVAKVGLSVIEPGVNPVVSYMRRLPRDVTPGTKFNYSTGETDLVGVLVSNAVRKPLAQYLSEKIWAPFGMEQDAIWVEDVAGHERGGCCMSMTLRDYGRIGMFILGGGKAGGKQVVPASWTKEATASHIPVDPAHPEAGGYGYFWWVNPKAKSYEALGIFGQSITTFPQDKLVIAINSAWPAADTPELNAARDSLTAAIRTAAVK
ncbi:serine hydrolase [Phenylobacterium sp. Root700]|uniref:serine hydrolase domain-containing protein n=1 Tax=Phenylobacterium sp. Root700 TaxID=1736591 RepID=UPI000AFD931C|nr:serine hydrolase [Phenylobacterium sp. Root700]